MMDENDTMTKEVRAYLTGLTWDGVQRLGSEDAASPRSWLEVYLGAKGGADVRATGRWWLVSAVARAFVPGCVAHLMVIHGPQGNGKTRALSALFSPWFSEDFSTEPGQLAGVWCAEVPEVSATAKSFLARTVDRYRPPHARQALDVPRQIVFCGTTNARPAADGRRCWPVEVGAVAPIDVDGLRRDRDQLFAEAVVLFNQGEPWWPASVEPSLTS